MGQLLTTGKAVTRSGIGRTKLLNLIRTGRLPVKMLDQRIRIDAQVLDDFVAALPQGYVPGPPVAVRPNNVPVTKRRKRISHASCRHRKGQER